MKKSIILSIVTLLTIGCTADDPEKMVVPEGEGMLSFKTTIADQTRSVAVIGSGFKHEAQINLILTDVAEGETNYNGAEKTYVYKKPTEGAGSWIPGEEGGHKLVGAEAMALSHYPAKLPNESKLSTDKKTLTLDLPSTLDFGTPETYNADNAFWMELESGKGEVEILLADGEVDYMIGKGETNVDNANLSTVIPMYHALGMLVVRAHKDPDNTNPGVLKSITFSNNSGTTLQKGSYNLTEKGSDAFHKNSESTSYQRTMEGFPDGTYFALMVYPANIGANTVNLLLLVDKTTYKLPINVREWKAGHIMFYNVTLKATTATLEESGMSSMPWPALEDENSHDVPLD